MNRSLWGSKHLDRLARKMQKGDNRAAGALYDELADKVFGFCFTRVRNKAVAEDLTQEIFLKLVSHIGTFDPSKGAFVVWFWRVARNSVFDYYRKEKEVLFTDVSEGGENNFLETIASYDPSRAFENSFSQGRLLTFMKSLSEEEQELFRLRFVADLSYKEIKEIAGKSEGTLRVAVSRLKDKIKNNLQQ